MAIRQIPIRPSANIASVLYNDEDQTMTIQFVSGSTYQYLQTPANIADGFAEAISPGKYFRLNVLNLLQYQQIS